MNAAVAVTSGSSPAHPAGPWAARPPPGAASAAGTPGDAASSPPPLLPRLIPPPSRGPAPHGPPPPLGHPPPRLLPPLDLLRPPRLPFFIREIYKNGFLKRLPHNERKSSPLSKLMRTDRYWTVFSVHDDAHPFLELWQEPSEVAAGRPPHMVYPLAICQHVSPSLVAADGEWSFVVNFESGTAIRFACNSRTAMEEWVDCVRHKLGDMGILPAKGNLYSRIPAVATNKVARNPMSPLPSPPVVATQAAAAPAIQTAASISTESRNRLSIVDASDAGNQSFTTSIYLNQTPPATPSNDAVARSKAVAKRRAQSRSLTNLSMDSTNSSSTVGGGYETIAPFLNQSESEAAPNSSATVSTSSVYLNKTASPRQQRHVTVIPINSKKKQEQLLKLQKEANGDSDKVKLAKSNSTNVVSPSSSKSKQKENQGSVYETVFDVPPRRRQRSPTRQHQQRPLSEVNEGAGGPPKPVGRLSRKEESGLVARSPPKVSSTSAGGGVLRHLSDSRKGHASGGNAHERGFDIQQRVRKRSQRSSSLGPLLDEHRNGGGTGNTKSSAPVTPLKHSAANTNSLESLDSNPRQAPAKADFRLRHNHRVISRQGLGGGAVPRRPLLFPPNPAPDRDRERDAGHHGHHRPGPPVPHGVHPQPPPPPTGFPPHIPLPGLTCQLSFPPGLPSMMHPPPSGSAGSLDQPQSQSLQSAAHPGHQPPRSSLREQQVIRLRQEMAHPAGVRLTLRRRDCQNSLALVEMFGCLWVAGWKQREYPVLYNAFHIGDQIVTVGGGPARTASDFHKAVKPPKDPLGGGNPSALYVEIVVRRVPFGQVFHLKREVEGQPLGIITQAGSSDVREVVSGSPAAQQGLTPAARSPLQPSPSEVPSIAPTPSSPTSATPSAAPAPPPLPPPPMLVPWTLTEINGRPLNLFAKDGEASDRLQAVGRDVSILVQPADLVQRLKKQLKSLRSYKDYVMN